MRFTVSISPTTHNSVSTTHTSTSAHLLFDNTMVHIFLTGASGGMGSALIPKLVAAGHTVSGLARSDSSIAKGQATGATAIRGDLSSVEVIAAADVAADIAINLAFDHERGWHKGDFLGFWIDASKALGYVPYTANGVWTACSYDAAAQCVADTLKVGADLPNPVTLQLVAEQGVPHKYIADIFAGKLSIPAKELEPDEFAQVAQLGPLAGVMTMTRPAKA